jgi:hypothetical protein
MSELSRVLLVEGFAAGDIDLDVVLAKISGAVEAPRTGGIDPDGDPSIGDLSATKLYRALVAGRVSEADYWAVYGALVGSSIV